MDSVKNWLAHPFDSGGSAVNWFLFIGLLIVISFLWSRVIDALKKV